MKNFCALPFHHVQVRTNGDFNVCCVHDMSESQNLNINNCTVDEWRNSEYMAEITQSFLDDKRHTGCSDCWKKEDHGFVSLRQRTANEYKILKINVDERKITNVEIGLSNQCNLTCHMCNENESSAILAENVKLGINLKLQKDFKWSDQGYQNLQALLMQNPKLVNIKGGEPFYVKKLLELIENIPEERAGTMALHITTNATMWSNRWHEALKKFKLIRFMFSIDATGDLYEYMRFPGNWETVQSNIDAICKLPNAQFLVHCVVQNLNIGSLGHLINWCKDKSLWLNFDLLDQPQYLKITNLSEQQKSKALLHLKNIDRSTLEPHHIQTIDNSIKLLESCYTETAEWNEFVKNISMRDRVRGNNYREFIN
jgi:molybdenum cofactor biosynthesis enzyme MoaA